jgi:hypothetical protein
MADFFGMGRPGGGLDIRTITVRLEAHAAISKGDVVAVSPTVFTDNEDTIPHFYKTQTQAAGNASVDDAQFGMFAVALESVASGAKGLFALSGIVDAATDGTSAVVAGNGLEADGVANNLNVADTPGRKVLGYALEAKGAGVGLIKVMFDGVNGFGTVES